MSYCVNCMAEIENNSVCPYCGFDRSKPQEEPFLPYQTVLKGKYIVGRVLSSNPENTVYAGLDAETEIPVKIREFLPLSVIERSEGKTEVSVPQNNAKVYDGLFNDFVLYYRILAGLKGLSANIEIHDIFPENNTCYVIEEDAELLPFTEYVERNGGRLEWDVLRPMAMPITFLLETMHAKGIGNYCVCPQNVFVTPSGKLKLICDGTENIRKRNTYLKAPLDSGVFAPEQYTAFEALDEQTDVYGFTALLFYALSGNMPAPVKERKKENNLFMSSTAAKRLPPHVLKALVNGLALDRDNRIASFEELRTKLSAENAAEAIREEISRTSMINSGKNRKKSEPQKRRSGMPVFIVSFILTVLVIVTAAMIMYSMGVFDKLGEEPTAPTTATQPTDGTQWQGPVIDNYIGLSYDEAVSKLENTKIELVRSYATVYSDIYESGIIVSQQPESGTPITSDDGSAVIYVEVSSGSKMRTLPDISGYTVDEAGEILGAEGFITSAISEYSSTVSEGRIIGYDGYSAGDRAEIGTEIFIRVSKGEAPDKPEDGIE